MEKIIKLISARVSTLLSLGFRVRKSPTASFNSNRKSLHPKICFIFTHKLRFMLLARLIYESFSFAGNSLRANKLRTFLSLLGITIGIFAIISVFTVIDSLESYIRKSLDTLGNNVVYVEKWRVSRCIRYC